MKTLKDYIMESSNSKYLSKLNLKGIPNSDSHDVEVGKDQEKFIIDRLNEAYPEYEWRSTEDYFGSSYNSKKDLVDGDIVGLKDSKVKFYIDVKTANTANKKYVGVISLNSILNFGTENHYYLCVNNDGSKFIVKKSAEIKDLFNKTDKCLKVSNSENRNKFVKKELGKYLDKFIDETNDVSHEDYMPSYIFNK